MHSWFKNGRPLGSWKEKLYLFVLFFVVMVCFFWSISSEPAAVCVVLTLWSPGNIDNMFWQVYVRTTHYFKIVILILILVHNLILLWDKKLIPFLPPLLFTVLCSGKNWYSEVLIHFKRRRFTYYIVSSFRNIFVWFACHLLL